LNSSGSRYRVIAAQDKVLASVGEDRRIRLSDAATGRPLRTLAGHADTIRAIAFAQTGKLLVSESRDSTVRLWNPSTRQQIGEPIRVGEPFRNSATFLAVAPDCKTLAFDKRGEGICLWDTAAAKTIRTIRCQAGSVAFAPDGRTLTPAERTRVGVIQLWDTETGKELWQVKGHRKAAFSVAFSPDGKTLVSGGGDFGDAQSPTHGEIKFWDPVGYSQEETIKKSGRPFRLRRPVGTGSTVFTIS
jgi:WD40 repeat protein